jgi:peptidoglycan/LPS O-acetylase OafA/YrhL
MSTVQETVQEGNPVFVKGPLEAAGGRTTARSTSLHIPSLDGIRALSFALVFLGHAGLNTVIPTTFGVTVFFFLSGYLITTLLRIEWQKTGHISLKKFYLRRALRILPPFYLVFILAYCAYRMGASPAPKEPASIPAVLFHYANYYMVVHDTQGFLFGTAVYWSLAVEEHFYLLFPCLFWLMARTGGSGRNQALFLLALCAVTLAWRCVLVFTLHVPMLRTLVASDTRVDSLLFGCALAVYENPALDRSSFSERAWKRHLFPLGLAALVLCFVVRNASFRETFRYSIQGLGLVPLFVCAARYPDWFPMRLLNLRPIAFVGVLSYSLYLIHLLVLSVLETHFASRLGPVAKGSLGMALSLLLSWLIYLTVEKPCARLRKRLSV